MVLLTPETRSEIVREIKKGVSINKISRSLGVWKSTIYYYYKTLKGRKYSLPDFSFAASEEEGEIVGIFAGDGSQYFEPKKHCYEVNVHFGGHKMAYAGYVKQLYESYFHKKFALRKEKSGVFRLRIRSKIIFNYFLHYLSYDPHIKHCTVFLRNLDLPADFRRGFLRGLVDTDGSALFNRQKAQCCNVLYYTTSGRLAMQIQFLLNEFGIVSSIYVRHQKHFKPIYHVRVLSRCIDTFLKTIQPFKACGPVAQR